jgi:hypothetical protein
VCEFGIELGLQLAQLGNGELGEVDWAGISFALCTFEGWSVLCPPGFCCWAIAEGWRRGLEHLLLEEMSGAGLWGTGNVRARFVASELGRLVTYLALTSASMPFAPRALLVSPAKRHYAVGAPKKKRFATVKCITSASNFGKQYNAQQPVRFKNFFKDIPAYEKWHAWSEERPEELRVARSKRSSKVPETIVTKTRLNMPYLEQHGDMTVPLELTTTSPNGLASFERFEGPFSLLLAHIVDKKDLSNRLYLAQHSLDDLPKGLRDDLPTPMDFLKSLGGAGDIYGSSLWMGKAPTRTPLHRDPNPNLFVQLSGKKTIRLMQPAAGKETYERIREMAGEAGGSATMRGEEMMQGKAMELLERTIWNDRLTQNSSVEGWEVTLKKGDGLYIPLGWWHAVRSTGKSPNVSVSYAASA